MRKGPSLTWCWSLSQSISKKWICFICPDDNNYHIIAVHPVLSVINLFHLIDVTHAMHMFPTISSKDCEQTLASEETPVPFMIHNSLVLFKCCLGNAWISYMYSTCITVFIFRVRYPFIRPLKLHPPGGYEIKPPLGEWLWLKLIFVNASLEWTVFVEPNHNKHLLETIHHQGLSRIETLLILFKSLSWWEL